MRHDIGRLLHHLAIAPDAITRQVGADVEIDPERGNARVADIGHANHGTRFRVELAKSVKRCRKLLREDSEIALHISRRDAGGAGGRSGAAGVTGCDAGR